MWRKRSTDFSIIWQSKGIKKVPGEPQSQKVREKSRECHNHKPQPFPDPKRKRKPTNLNKHKPEKRTKRGNRNTKRTEKHKNKMTHGKTYNKSPRRINHKATKSKTNTGTTALKRSVEQTTGGFKALLQLTNFTPSQTPKGRGNRQNQTSANRTNVRKALRLALTSPSEVIAKLKGLKNTRIK